MFLNSEKRGQHFVGSARSYILLFRELENVFGEQIISRVLILA
jgi:hypothetical protein